MTNRKKREKSVPRKKGNVHVLSVLVKGVTAPIRYRAHGNQSSCKGREQRKQVMYDCNKPIF